MKAEKRIWRIGSLITVLLLLLSTRIVYWQLVRGQELQPVALDPLAMAEKNTGTFMKGNRLTEEALEYLIGDSQSGEAQGLPQPVIQRTRELLQNITRGSIFDRSGQPLAYDVLDENGERTRFYTEPSLAPVIGYVSGLRTGIAGLELSYNEPLLGLNRPIAQLERLIHQPIEGSNLHLTIDSRVQREAEEALAGQAGAAVVIDGESGAILAMASSPHIDPNRVGEPGYLANLLDRCEDGADCQGVFINRATQALYVPGSTWKTVTLIAALDSDQVSTETVFDFGKPVSGPNGRYYVYEVDGGIIPDPNHQESKLSLEMSYAKSANAAFARMADEMPAATFVDYAQRLGFSNPDDNYFPLEIPYSPSQLSGEVSSLYENNLLRAATGIGQGELLVTPINMGMVVLAVVNDGDMPVPYLVERVEDPAGFDNRGRTRGRVIRNIMSTETARTVKEMMVTTIEQGSGFRAGLQGLTAGGKTGTAQLGGDAAPHAWFIGFAEEEARSVVIAVLVEHGGQGSQAAAPIFARLAQAAMEGLD